MLWWFRRFAPHPFNIWLTNRMLPGRKHWRGNELLDESPAMRPTERNR